MLFGFFNNDNASDLFYKYLHFSAIFCNSLYERNGLLSNIYTNTVNQNNCTQPEHQPSDNKIINKIIYCFCFNSLHQLNETKNKIINEQQSGTLCTQNDNTPKCAEHLTLKFQSNVCVQDLLYKLEFESNPKRAPIIFHVGAIHGFLKNADYPNLQLNVNDSSAHLSCPPHNTQNNFLCPTSKNSSFFQSQSIENPTNDNQQTNSPPHQQKLTPGKAPSDWDKAVRLSTPLLRIINNLFCAIDLKPINQPINQNHNNKSRNHICTIYADLLTKSLMHNKALLFTLWEHHFFFDRALFVRSPIFQYFLAHSVLTHSNFFLIEWMHSVAWMSENHYKQCAQPFFCSLEENLSQSKSYNVKFLIDDLVKSISYLKDQQQHNFSQKITNFFVVQIEQIILKTQLNHLLSDSKTQKKCLKTL